MSPEAQRIAITEACGWTKVKTSGPFDTLIGHKPHSGTWSHLPDYLSDLNAMHEAESVLSTEKRRNYGRELNYIVNGDTTSDQYSFGDIFAIAHATAAQRAEAFLRTLGLWDTAQ